LVTTGFLTSAEVNRESEWRPLFDQLRAAGRATTASHVSWPGTMWVAAERLPELQAVQGDLHLDPALTAPAERAAVLWTRPSAALELFRGRLALLGPVTPRQVGEPLGFEAAEAENVLLALESEGVVLRGWFSPGGATEEWCDRRLLARIHRATLQRLRAEIQPITPADFMRFLFEWQHLTPSSRVSGVDGVRAVIAQLDGFELAADAWDKHVLPARVAGYDTATLDLLCYSGEAAWARLTQPPAPSPSALLPTRPVRATPVALFLRDHARQWQVLGNIDHSSAQVSDLGAAVLRVLERGAQFVQGIADAATLPVHDVREALSELVWAGLVASDGFAGLRAMWSGPPPPPVRRVTGYGATAGGRWSKLETEPPAAGDREAAVEQYAQVLLRRYGIICRRLLAREPYAVPWRELLRVYRRLEARGDIRGGRFVSGLAGEQFALPEAVAVARQVRRTKAAGDTVTISAADPLNLCGIITAGDRVPAVASTVITFRDGVPLPSAEEELTHAAHSA
jgi:ATP-dependent Lhr-like helicase